MARSECCCGCLRGTLRFANYVLALAGLSMVAYAMHMYAQWLDKFPSTMPPPPPDSPSPMDTYMFNSTGLQRSQSFRISSGTLESVSTFGRDAHDSHAHGVNTQLHKGIGEYVSFRDARILSTSSCTAMATNNVYMFR